MSLKFPVSLVGKRGGGAPDVDLTANIIRWFENFQTPDESAGLEGINTAGIPSSTVNIPSPFTTAYAPVKDPIWVSTGAFNPADITSYTYFMVTRLTSNGFGRTVWSTGSSGTTGDTMREKSGGGYECKADGGSFATVSASLNVWHSFVFVKTGNTLSIYRDGILVATPSGVTPDNSASWRTWDSQKTNLLVFGSADRAWTQDDIDAFHNGGSFVRWADL